MARAQTCQTTACLRHAASLADIERLLGQAIETDPALVSARQALTTARTFRLSVCDAVYLDVARRERLPLATLDEKLRATAKQAGVALLRSSFSFLTPAFQAQHSRQSSPGEPWVPPRGTTLGHRIIRRDHEKDVSATRPKR